MSIEVINEALELLRIAQSGMGPDPGYLDRYDRHHWHRISKCRQELEKLKQQEPAKYEFQNRDGTWHGFLNESHYQNTVEDGSWPIRALYAAPVPAAVQDGWKLTDSQVDRMLSAPIPGGSSARDWFLPHDTERGLGNVRDVVRAMLSAAPAAPAVTEQTRAASEGLEKLKQQEPVVTIKQNASGQIHMVGYDGNSFDMSKHVGKSFYAAPVPAAVSDGWLALVSDVLAYFDTPAHDFSAEQEQRLIVRLQAMLSAAPASAVPEDVAKDTERLDFLEAKAKMSRTGVSFDYCRYSDGVEKGYRVMWYHTQLDRSPTLRAAIDAAMQKGGV